MHGGISALKRVFMLPKKRQITFLRLQRLLKLFATVPGGKQGLRSNPGCFDSLTPFKGCLFVFGKDGKHTAVGYFSALS